jgi:ketosteroid isomerase-like protein
MLKLRVPFSVACLGVVLISGPGCVSHESERESSVARVIWSLEQAYFEHNRNADYEKIVSTWHEEFLGWPDPEPKPIDKEEGARYVRRNFKEPASFTFEIEPAGIRVVGDVAVNHYTVHFTTKDDQGREEKRSLRVTHTWIKENGEWKVLAGMSNSE